MFGSSVEAQTYKFEGKNVVVEVPETGNSCGVRYGSEGVGVGTPTITVAQAPGKSNTNIYKCDSSSTLIGSTPQTITRDAAGYFCFQGNDTVYSISFPYASGTKTYDRWIANPPDTTQAFVPAYPYSTLFYNVKDFGAKGDSTNDDTDEIKNAIAYVAARQGGTLYFPPGDYVVSDSDGKGIGLPSGIVLQGATSLPQTASHNYFKSEQFSRIRVKNSNERIFRIGECTTDVKIKNLVLRADPSGGDIAKTGTYGIEAVGKINTSQLIGLSDVSFEYFDIGFYVHNPPGTLESNKIWQLESVKLDHCFFIRNKTAGIFLDTFNTDWKITNSLFALPVKNTGLGIAADGLKTKHAGAIIVEGSFGSSTSTGAGGDLFNFEGVGPVTMIGNEAENVTYAFEYGAPGSEGLALPITFINNIFGSDTKVRFNSRTILVSTGNQYGSETFADNVQRSGGYVTGLTPLIFSGVQIYSSGDRFCYDGNISGCNPTITKEDAANFNLGNFTGGNLVFSTGQPEDNTVPARPTVIKLPIGSDVTVRNNGANTTKPLFTITSPNYLKPLMELGNRNDDGTNNFVYKITREANGYLTFKGTQANPYKGYDFDAPLTLGQYTQSTLPAGSVTNGTITFCLDCQKSTSPCATAASNGGALAILVNNQWECK